MLCDLSTIFRLEPFDYGKMLDLQIQHHLLTAELEGSALSEDKLFRFHEFRASDYEVS